MRPNRGWALADARSSRGSGAGAAGVDGGPVGQGAVDVEAAEGIEECGLLGFAAAQRTGPAQGGRGGAELSHGGEHRMGTDLQETRAPVSD
jgi:hypothetical protein